MRTVKLLLAVWTAAIPERWVDFEVQFAPADTSFSNWAGGKITALKDSLLRGSGPEVDGLFDGMIKNGWAEEVAVVFEEAHSA